MKTIWLILIRQMNMDTTRNQWTLLILIQKWIKYLTFYIGHISQNHTWSYLANKFSHYVRQYIICIIWNIKWLELLESQNFTKTETSCGFLSPKHQSNTTVSVPLYWRGQPSVPNFEKRGIRKRWVPEWP